MLSKIKKYLTDIKFYYSILGLLLIVIVSAQIYINTVPVEPAQTVNGNSLDLELIQAAALEESEFGKDKGMISVKCTGIGQGSVYICVNGKIKANVTSSDLKSFKVKKGDSFIVKGHLLTGTATVTIESAVGNIDTSIAGTSVTVGNLGKYLVKIE